VVTAEEAAFVEAMGQFLTSGGMPPIAGRMWGWLLICDPPEQSAAELAEALHASRGAISGAARILQTAGFVRRISRRGDRREYFSAPPQAFRAIIQGGAQSYRQFREVAALGLATVADKPEPVSLRIREVYEFARFVEVEVPTVLERFTAFREAALGTDTAQDTEKGT
jgi:hypothetical protein